MHVIVGSLTGRRFAMNSSWPGAYAEALPISEALCGTVCEVQTSLLSDPTEGTYVTEDASSDVSQSPEMPKMSWLTLTAG